MVFQKGREKSGGRKKGASNKATESIKNTLNALLTEDELEECWRRFLNHKDSSIAWKAFELYHEYRFGKPVQMVVGESSRRRSRLTSARFRNIASRFRNDFAAAR